MITISILGVVIRVTTPLLLASTGALYNDRAGVTNIAIEGTMLISAFIAVVISYFTQSWALAILGAVAAGMLVSLLFTFLTSVLGGDELVVGFSLNVLIGGLTIYLLKQVFSVSGSIVSDLIVGVPRVQIPFLENVPILNELFNGQTILVFLAFLCVIATQIIIYRTPAGLRILACGESPNAAATVGVDVLKTRRICNLVAGAMCGLAGIQISLGYLSMFSEGMTVGRGFIALATVIFSRGKPLRILALTLFFGLAEALSNQMQLLNLPSELVLMLPYVAVVVLTFFSGGKIKKRIGR